MPGRMVQVYDPKAKVVKPPELVWPEKFLDPDLQNSGSSRIDIDSMVLWLHPQQDGTGRGIKGNFIYDDLKLGGHLIDCFGLLELEAIKRAIEAYKIPWKLEWLGADGRSKALFGWKSSKKKGENKSAPYLIRKAKTGEFAIQWASFGEIFEEGDVALRYGRHGDQTFGVHLK